MPHRQNHLIAITVFAYKKKKIMLILILNLILTDGKHFSQSANFLQNYFDFIMDTDNYKSFEIDLHEKRYSFSENFILVIIQILLS